MKTGFSKIIIMAVCLVALIAVVTPAATIGAQTATPDPSSLVMIVGPVDLSSGSIVVNGFTIAPASAFTPSILHQGDMVIITGYLLPDGVTIQAESFEFFAELTPTVTPTFTPTLVLLPTAAFSFFVTDPANPLAITFVNQSTGTGSLLFAWNFGDGQTSGEQNPVHVYAQAATYIVTLTVTDANGTTSVQQAVPVGVATFTPSFTPTFTPTATPTLVPTAAFTPSSTPLPDDCNRPDHPVAQRLAEAFGVPYEVIMGYHCQGFGFGEIARAYLLAAETGVDPQAYFDMKASGMGWGQIVREAGVHPSNLSPGQVINGHWNDEDRDQDDDDHDNDNGNGNGNGHGGRPDCPGNSCNAPGHNGGNGNGNGNN